MLNDNQNKSNVHCTHPLLIPLEATAAATASAATASLLVGVAHRGHVVPTSARAIVGGVRLGGLLLLLMVIRRMLLLLVVMRVGKPSVAPSAPELIGMEASPSAAHPPSSASPSHVANERRTPNSRRHRRRRRRRGRELMHHVVHEVGRGCGHDAGPYASAAPPARRSEDVAGGRTPSLGRLLPSGPGARRLRRGRQRRVVAVLGTVPH